MRKRDGSHDRRSYGKRKYVLSGWVSLNLIVERAELSENPWLGHVESGLKPIWPESRRRKNENYDRGERGGGACYAEFGNF